MYNVFQVGQEYPFQNSTVHVFCMKENQVMLEKKLDDEVICYIVATNPYICEEQIAWGSGAYYPCKADSSTYDTPFEAFSKAWKYLNGQTYVHALIADTKYGPSVTLYGNRQLAMQALQRTLDEDTSIQSLAEIRGIKPLAARAYVQGALSDSPFPIDEYSIRTRVVNESIPEIEEVDDCE